VRTYNIKKVIALRNVKSPSRKEYMSLWNSNFGGLAGSLVLTSHPILDFFSDEKV
jgi:hypothetical protein